VLRGSTSSGGARNFGKIVSLRWPVKGALPGEGRMSLKLRFEGTTWRKCGQLSLWPLCLMFFWFITKTGVCKFEAKLKEE
jgi:hypothetical protein